MGLAVCPEHLLFSRRLFGLRGIAKMGSDPAVHDCEGRLDCRCLFVAIMAFESDYTHFTRLAFFGTGGASAETATLPQMSGIKAASLSAPGQPHAARSRGH